MPKKRKNVPEHELPVQNGAKGNGEGKKTKVPRNGNGETHVLAENFAAPAPHLFKPGKIDLALQRRVDRGFLDYASHFIRDRAIPYLADGLKPVQRRILCALHQMVDGRFIKVANIVGETLK